jgi:hypothetical protein
VFCWFGRLQKAKQAHGCESAYKLLMKPKVCCGFRNRDLRNGCKLDRQTVLVLQMMSEYCPGTELDKN